MDSWEYLVIHLNVEPPKPAPPGQAPAPEPPPAEPVQARPVFSESFLKKEFPQFYEAGGEQAPAAPQHPAQQLQGFLNGHGAQGWILIGLFPVGVLPMLVFRRPRQAPEAQPQSAAEPAEAAPPPDQGSALQAVLERLEALERRLSGPEPAAVAEAPASRSAADGTAAKPSASRGSNATGRTTRRRSSAATAAADEPISGLPRLSASQLQQLASEPTLPSSAAARAIGLRSAASLANLGARHGYRPGLCKRGPNGMVAVYCGTGPARGGGKERRLWVVVGQERLQA